MSHEVENKVMVANGMHSWHGLDNVVEGQATGTQALSLGCLDWTVSMEPVSVIKPDYTETTPDYFACVRSSDHKILGVAKERYTPFQNAEAIDLGEQIVSASKGSAIWETSGSLRSGARAFATINLGATEIVKNDEVRKYLGIFWSHDGSLRLSVLNHTTRVVCANTVAAAFREDCLRINLKHTGAIHDRAIDAARALHLAHEELDLITNAMKRFASVKLTEEIQTYVLDKAMPLPVRKFTVDTSTTGTSTLDSLVANTGTSDRGFTLASNKRNRIKDLVSCGIGNDIPGVEGTAYALWNAFAEYGTHEATVRPQNGRSEAEVRFESSLYGPASEVKARAFAALQSVC
jgi:phage/plasmid-like protein (TIGR03299 family)